MLMILMLMTMPNKMKKQQQQQEQQQKTHNDCFTSAKRFHMKAELFLLTVTIMRSKHRTWSEEEDRHQNKTEIPS